MSKKNKNNEMVIRISKDDNGKVDMKAEYPEDGELVTIGMAVIAFMQDHKTLVRYLNHVKELLADVAAKEDKQ